MVTREDVIADLQRVYRLVGRKVFSRKTYCRLGRLSVHYSKERFGTFGAALVEAGLPVSRIVMREDAHAEERPGQRRCLCCGDWFRSENTLLLRCCPPCRERNAQESEDNTYVLRLGAPHR